MAVLSVAKNTEPKTIDKTRVVNCCLLDPFEQEVLPWNIDATTTLIHGHTWPNISDYKPSIHVLDPLEPCIGQKNFTYGFISAILRRCHRCVSKKTSPRNLSAALFVHGGKILLLILYKVLLSLVDESIYNRLFLVRWSPWCTNIVDGTGSDALLFVAISLALFLAPNDERRRKQPLIV